MILSGQVAQQRCEECGGSGLVLMEDDYFRCPQCGINSDFRVFRDDFLRQKLPWFFTFVSFGQVGFCLGSHGSDSFGAKHLKKQQKALHLSTSIP